MAIIQQHVYNKQLKQYEKKLHNKWMYNKEFTPHPQNLNQALWLP